MTTPEQAGCLYYEQVDEMNLDRLGMANLTIRNNTLV
jgi:hypothetical protein